MWSGALNALSGGKFGQSAWDSSNTSLSTMDPAQMEYLQKMLPMLWGGASGESNTGLDNMLSSQRTSAENNWSTKTLPQIYESAGNLHSSYLGNKVGQEYNNLELGLNQNETSTRYQNQMQMMQGLLAALGISTKENVVDKPGTAEGMLGMFGISGK